MAGIYLHIPFCKQACHYCNFHFSTVRKHQKEVIDGMLWELKHRRNYLDEATIESIYFGGGTPSLLSNDELNALFEGIYTHYKVTEFPEVTLEVNPDDLDLKKLKSLKQTPVNRLSIGIQSFFDRDLKFMNRAHNAVEAEKCIKNARVEGFGNITIDLIYGTPTMTFEDWKANVNKAIGLGVPHLSCYCLTVEPKTALHHFVKTGQVAEVNDEYASAQFNYLIQATREAGYDHYEISNFAKPDYYAKHNSAYWKGETYLGIGPGAHSFNGTSRQWNVANNSLYVKATEKGELAFEQEILTLEQRYNEYILTSIRTIWGIEMKVVKSYGEAFVHHFSDKIAPFIREDLIKVESNNFTLTDKGKLLADRIASDLFSVSE